MLNTTIFWHCYTIHKPQTNNSFLPSIVSYSDSENSNLDQHFIPFCYIGIMSDIFNNDVLALHLCI